MTSKVISDDTKEIIKQISDTLSTDNLAKLTNELSDKVDDDVTKRRFFDLIVSNDYKKLFGWLTYNNHDVLNIHDKNKFSTNVVGYYDNKKSTITIDKTEYKVVVTNIYALILHDISSVLDAFIAGSISSLNTFPLYLDSSDMSLIIKYVGYTNLAGASLATAFMKIGCLFAEIPSSALANFGSIILLAIGAYSETGSTAKDFEEQIKAYNDQHKDDQVKIEDNKYNALSSFFAFYANFTQSVISAVLLLTASVVLNKAKEKMNGFELNDFEQKAKNSFEKIANNAFKDSVNIIL